MPGEDATACLDTLNKVVAEGVTCLKLHPLHIVDGSILARAWRAGRLTTLTLDAYAAIACEMIRHTPPDIIFHRVSANARRPVLLAQKWCENRWHGMLAVYHYLQQRGPQGSALGRPWRLPVAEDGECFLAIDNADSVKHP